MHSTSEIILRPSQLEDNLTSSTLEFQSITSKSSSFHYRNPRLEKIIHAKQSKSQLSLNSMELVDQDMEILANFLLRNDTVRNRNLL